GLPAFTSVFHCDAQGPGRLHVSSRSMHCFACFCTSRGFNSNSVSVCVLMKGLTPPSPPLPSMINETDSTLTTLDALKARIRDLEKQLSKGDRFKCLICMDTYTTPLTSIQCWHVHCEECWLRTLGAKKLCPQCNTITSPGDLRRVFL
uniref:E3 ubiquitin-protein ligase RNF220 n=1 Tax=Oryzias sinensis TaxID=183150 RepID=A0A8C7XBM0_9TELE